MSLKEGCPQFKRGWITEVCIQHEPLRWKQARYKGLEDFGREGCTILIEVRKHSSWKREGEHYFWTPCFDIKAVLFCFFQTWQRNVINATATFRRWQWEKLSPVLQWYECTSHCCWWGMLLWSPHSSMDTTVMPTTTADFLVRIFHLTIQTLFGSSAKSSRTYGRIFNT